jgi:hypothetical protein
MPGPGRLARSPCERRAGLSRWRSSTRFRSEFLPAFQAWLASAPAGTIPPGTPFALPAYQLAEQTRSDDLSSQAEAFTAEARAANQTGDDFVLLAVIFASVLFFAGVGTKFRGYRVRVVMVAFAVGLFGLALIFVFSLPQNVGIWALPAGADDLVVRQGAVRQGEAADCGWAEEQSTRVGRPPWDDWLSSVRPASAGSASAAT